MLISGVHFDFFSPKEAELQVRRLQKNLSPKSVASRRNRKKKTKQNKKTRYSRNASYYDNRMPWEINAPRMKHPASCQCLKRCYFGLLGKLNNS